MYPFSTASTVGSCESKQDLLPSLRHLPAGRVAGIQMRSQTQMPLGATRVSRRERARGPVIAAKGIEPSLPELPFSFYKKTWKSGFL